MSQRLDIRVKQKAVYPGIDDRPPCEQEGMPETITNWLADVECRGQLGGVVKSMHRKAAWGWSRAASSTAVAPRSGRVSAVKIS